MTKILAVNINFQDREDIVSGVSFTQWNSGRAENVFLSKVENTEDYLSGEIFARELKIVNTLLSQTKAQPDYILLDGLVYSDGKAEPGFGKRLYDELGGNVVIIGVVKKQIQGLPDECGVCRGESKTPLFVTAVGIDLEAAKELLLSMHGKFRVPSILKLAEKKSRGK